MKTYQLFLLSLLSALLLAFGWFPHGFVPLLFIAFVPLLIVEHAIFNNPQKYKTLTLFACSYLTFFTWNVLTTWWVKNASFGGAAMAIGCNALLMTITFMLFHKVKKRVGEKWGTLVFSCFWITFEFLHLDWDLTWTWLTIGNGFAPTLNWIQWYEYTGVFGGTLWVLITNCFIFKIVSDGSFRVSKKQIIGLGALLVLPILCSYIILAFYVDLKTNTNVVIVQPNIDPYNEKFISGYEVQLQKMLQLALQQTDTTTDYLVFPETALTEAIWEDEFMQSSSIKTLKEFLKPYPKLKIIIGASTAKVYQPDEALSSTARKFRSEDAYYDSYNTALQIDSSNLIQIYHKSKLVPGVEKMPFPFIFKHLGKLAIDLGGTTGSLGIQDERSVFVSLDGTIKAAPVVCYESVYGEYVSEYVKNGAQFIAIITNDGWWGDTPGYKQHLKYGALRAIETRRYVVRSANTGVSCVITNKGEIQQATNWWVPAVIKTQIKLNNELTFYTRYGDYIGRAAMYLSLLLILYSWLLRFKIIRK
ncbi:MAG: apolipoprotein N-acyltransferase [Bacteroidetes bacterium]|nr:apolipoprotein N-acyltransferase [Bacteroidota bacterium]